tara:strand:+ start:236 stop:577 length:342 start_codon:yes stop_codon:yes gene_type:complete
MKKYIALIMKSDDFGWGLEEDETVEDILIQGYLEKENWVTGYEFECPDSLSEELVVLLGHGHFWENGWTVDDTISCMMEDTGDEEDEDSEKPEQDAGSKPEDEDAIIIKATIS